MIRTAKTRMFRVLAVLPAGLGLVVLGITALPLASSVRKGEWLFLALAVLVGLLGARLFRCGYLLWRQPSPITIRAACGWMAFVNMAVASLTVERLGASRHDLLAWLVALISIPFIVAVHL